MATRKRKHRKRRKVPVDPRKLYHLTTPPTPPSTSSSSSSHDKHGGSGGTGPYHSQLHSSLQAFRARKWRPISPDSLPRPTVTRCRPISARPSSAGQSFIPHPPNEQRPDNDFRDHPFNQDYPYKDHPFTRDHSPSSPGSHITVNYPRRPDTPRVTPGNFDTLSPRVLSHLVTDPRPLTPLSTYGDRVYQKGGKLRSEKSKKLRSKTEEEIFNDSSSAFSMSDGDDDDNDDDEDASDESDDESISELERGLEPALDHRRKVPDLQLRPEQLDHVYVPLNKRDMRRFDFDAEKVDIPLYEFACPIPHPFSKINFRFHARENTEWRFTSVNLSGYPEDPVLSKLMDRLVEIEKRQIETEEWEEKRLKSSRKRIPSRVGGNVTNKAKDKRCCSSCLQPCCVGDCPNKRTGHPLHCETCHQPLCTGSCQDTRYDQRMRQPPDTNVPLPPPVPFPKNCRTCQKKHNAKLINANHVVLGRPKSAYATYSRGRNSTRPKDLRPKSAVNIENSISQKFEQLGLEPVQSRPSSSAKSSRPSSRNGLMPGKTYYSNLSHSLTDLTSKRRCKSARLRRPRCVKAKMTKSIENNV